MSFVMYNMGTPENQFKCRAHSLLYDLLKQLINDVCESAAKRKRKTNMAKVLLPKNIAVSAVCHENGTLRYS